MSRTLPDPRYNNEGYKCSAKTDLAKQIKSRIAALQGLSIADNPDRNPIIPIPILLQRIHQKAPLATIFVAATRTCSARQPRATRATGRRQVSTIARSARFRLTCPPRPSTTPTRNG